MVKIEAKELSKSYGKKKVLDSLTFASGGGITGILGPSGCGKTTLLRLLAGLEEADSGSIKIGGKIVLDCDEGIFVQPQKRGVGMVFQDLALWPHMTVRQHLEFVLDAKKTPKDKEKRINKCLKSVGLETRAQDHPGKLSGGEKQRVAISRALVGEPHVLLMDEPLSNLDQILRTGLRKEIKRISAESGVGIIYVTHDPRDVLDISDELIILNNGNIVQHGKTHDVVREPKNDYVSAILGLSE